MYNTSIIGTWFVKLGKSKNIMGALYKGFIVTAVTSLLILYPVTDSIVGLDNSYSNSGKFDGIDLYICGVVGFIIRTINLDWYYTGTTTDQLNQLLSLPLQVMEQMLFKV